MLMGKSPRQEAIRPALRHRYRRPETRRDGGNNGHEPEGSTRNARKAHAETLVVRDMRVAMTAGRATQAEIEAAERRREDAVQSALSPLPIVDIFFSPIVRKRDLPQPSYKGVNLENITSFSVFENGREVTVVSGAARNTGRNRMEMPPLTLEALDRWDFVLSGQSSLLPFQYLEPGEARSFDIRLLNPPRNTIEVYVHFAPPFRYRWPRDCAFFDSARSTSDGLLGELVNRYQMRDHASVLAQLSVDAIQLLLQLLAALAQVIHLPEAVRGDAPDVGIPPCPVLGFLGV
jgi:hypothetical protein